jgi:3-oxoacyl-[acyl-carrier-protein] synthase II
VSIYPNLLTEPVAAELVVALCLCFGFGGQKGVLALGGDR